MTEKRNIYALIQREEPHLNEILDPEQVTKFKELTNELRDTWTKKQMFRTKTEMEFSVLFQYHSYGHQKTSALGFPYAYFVLEHIANT